MQEGLLSAGHDRSDGGLVVTLLEMAFAGNCGLDVTLPLDCESSASLIDHLALLFAEELGT